MRYLGYLGYLIIGGLLGVALSGCDSSPASQSAPPPAQPSVTTPDTQGPRPVKPHGPDTEDHNSEIKDLRSKRFEIVVGDDVSFNELVIDAHPGAHPGPGKDIHDGAIEALGHSRDSNCTFKDTRGNQSFKKGDIIEMTDLQIEGALLDATSQDQTVVMTCKNVRTASDFRVSDLDRILGGVATVRLDPRTF